MSIGMTHGGGWVAERASTGGSFNVVQRVGWALAAAGAALCSIGTGSALEVEMQRAATQVHHAPFISEFAETTKLRTPLEDLERIRTTLSPSISDLANTFGVTRQSVYNWLNGGVVAEGNAAKLRDLAQAADVLTHEGVVINSALLKRKIMGGKSLLQIAQAGMSAKDAALTLVHVLKREDAQRERLRARGVVRSGVATADFDLPTPNDNA